MLIWALLRFSGTNSSISYNTLTVRSGEIAFGKRSKKKEGEAPHNQYLGNTEESLSIRLNTV